jgi:RES domain
MLTPLPTSRPLKVSRLGVSTSQTLRLAWVTLERLGVDMSQYGVRDYRRTQTIGAALALLGLDGLIAPSARWACDNLMIYTANHPLTERLELIEARPSIGDLGHARTAFLMSDILAKPVTTRAASASLHG